jgi:hypothetical protein
MEYLQSSELAWQAPTFTDEAYTSGRQSVARPATGVAKPTGTAVATGAAKHSATTGKVSIAPAAPTAVGKDLTDGKAPPPFKRVPGPSKHSPLRCVSNEMLADIDLIQLYKSLLALRWCAYPTPARKILCFLLQAIFRAPVLREPAVS